MEIEPIALWVEADALPDVLLIGRTMRKFVFFLLSAFSLASAQAQEGCCAKRKCHQAKTSQSPVLIQQQVQNGASYVRIDTKSEAPLHFYLFDLEGTLVHQAILQASETGQVVNIKKGIYVYTVFAKDESIDEGKLVIK